MFSFSKFLFLNEKIIIKAFNIDLKQFKSNTNCLPIRYTSAYKFVERNKTDAIKK